MYEEVPLYYRDPTAECAMISVKHEWCHLLKTAYLYRTDRIHPRDTRTFETQYLGIYAQLLTDTIDDLEKQLPQRMRDQLHI